MADTSQTEDYENEVQQAKRLRDSHAQQVTLPSGRRAGCCALGAGYVCTYIRTVSYVRMCFVGDVCVRVIVVCVLWYMSPVIIAMRIAYLCLCASCCALWCMLCGVCCALCIVLCCLCVLCDRYKCCECEWSSLMGAVHMGVLYTCTCAGWCANGWVVVWWVLHCCKCDPHGLCGHHRSKTRPRQMRQQKSHPGVER